MITRTSDRSSYVPTAVSPHLLIGNDHALYREALAGAVRILRPTVPVRQVAPSELNAAVSQLRPLLVICSELTKSIEEWVCAWLVLRPAGAGASVVCVAGKRRTVTHPSLDELVQLIDEVWALAADR